MYTVLRATSQTLTAYLRDQLQADPNLAPFFDPGAGGTMLVTLNTPREMRDNNSEGLSVWLYRVVRDQDRLNEPPERIGPNRIRPTPLPLRLHYLMTPITNTQTLVGPETEQVILGKLLQVFHDHPHLRGADLQGDLSGTEAELIVRLETMGLEEIARVWEALEGSYQLSVSYEVSAVRIEPGTQPLPAGPVFAGLPEYAVIVGAGE